MSPATPGITLNPSSAARFCKSALKAPQINVFTPLASNTCKRSRGPNSGAQNSWPMSPSGVEGKINTREHQFKTGATRPRMTGMAIIPVRLPCG
jgi:hypothetical protein